MLTLVVTARNVVLAFKLVKAAAGILLVAHGTYKWVQNRQVERLRRPRR